MPFFNLVRPTSTRLIGVLLASTCLALPIRAEQPVASTPGAGASDASTAKPAQAETAKLKPAGQTGSNSSADEASGKGGAKKDAANADGTGAAMAKDDRMSDERAFFDARLAGLHAGLGLTADQEQLWPAVETAVRGLHDSRGGRKDREEVADLLQKSPGDLLRMRSEQLIRRGQAMKTLVDATGPLVDKLDESQKRRLPLLLQGMRPARILRAAFDIRYGQVVNDPDDNATSGAGRGDRSSDNSRTDDDGRGFHRHRRMYDGDGADRDDRTGAYYDHGRGDGPMAADRRPDANDD